MAIGEVLLKARSSVLNAISRLETTLNRTNKQTQILAVLNKKCSCCCTSFIEVLFIFWWSVIILLGVRQLFFPFATVSKWRVNESPKMVYSGDHEHVPSRGFFLCLTWVFVDVNQLFPCLSSALREKVSSWQNEEWTLTRIIWNNDGVFGCFIR